MEVKLSKKKAMEYHKLLRYDPVQAVRWLYNHNLEVRIIPKLKFFKRSK